MKKLLIVNSNLQIGGVQEALVSLLLQIHKDYDITLALFSPCGPLLQRLPGDIKVIGVDSPYRYLGTSRRELQGKPVQKLLRAGYAGVCRIFGRTAAMALMAPFQKKMEGYDVAISFVHDGYDNAFYGGCNSFVLRHVQATKKVTFLHGDYVKCGGNTPKNAARYEKFDHICACSQGCADSFLSVLPQLKDKVHIVPNCHDFDRIRTLADTQVTMDAAGIKILSVARFGAEKAIPRAVEALAAAGHTPIINTGRPYSHIDPRVRAMAFAGWVCSGGMEVYVDGKWLQKYRMSEEVRKVVIDAVRECRMQVFYEAVGGFWLVPMLFSLLNTVGVL